MRAAIFALATLVGCGSSSETSGSDGGAADAAGGDDASILQDGSSGDASSDASGADVVVGDATILGDAGSPRTFTVTNKCTQKVWAAARPTTTFPNGQYVEMAPGYSFVVGVPNGWSGRVWGKTGCTTTGMRTTCASDGLPASLAELTLTSSPTGLDFYDVSLVDGFNLPIAIVAVGHTPDTAHPYNCGDPTCSANLDATCAQPFQRVVSGAVIACANDACKVIGMNNPNDPSCIYPNQYTRFFKTACPTSYSYPQDDPTSTFTCKGISSYEIVFCP
jgi:Thaumatin family